MNSAEFNGLSFPEQAAHLQALLTVHIAEDAATSVEMDELEHLLPGFLSKLQQYTELPFLGGRAMSWADVGVYCTALPPHLAAQPALVQWRRHNEDWGEVRPLTFYTNGFADGKWVLAFEAYSGDLSTCSRETFEEGKEDFDFVADEREKAPAIVRLLLLEQPFLLAEFETDETVLQNLRTTAPQLEPKPAPAPLFEDNPARPPLGVYPAKLWRQDCGISFSYQANPQQASERFAAVQAAVLRYVTAGWPVPSEIAHEYSAWAVERGAMPPKE